jgi:hypothetical protein
VAARHPGAMSIAGLSLARLPAWPTGNEERREHQGAHRCECYGADDFERCIVGLGKLSMHHHIHLGQGKYGEHNDAGSSLHKGRTYATWPASRAPGTRTLHDHFGMQIENEAERRHTAEPEDDYH